MRVICGGEPYAIGHHVDNGAFFVRTIRFGKLAASYERREGEHIYRTMLTLAELPSRPLSTTVATESTSYANNFGKAPRRPKVDQADKK